MNRLSFSHNVNCRLKPLSRLYSALTIASTPSRLFFFFNKHELYVLQRQIFKVSYRLVHIDKEIITQNSCLT